MLDMTLTGCRCSFVFQFWRYFLTEIQAQTQGKNINALFTPYRKCTEPKQSIMLAVKAQHVPCTTYSVLNSPVKHTVFGTGWTWMNLDSWKSPATTSAWLRTSQQTCLNLLTGEEWCRWNRTKAQFDRESLIVVVHLSEVICWKQVLSQQTGLHVE